MEAALLALAHSVGKNIAVTAAEAVNALLDVADDEKILVFQQAEYPLLHGVGILVLVDENVFVGLFKLLPDIGKT